MIEPVVSTDEGPLILVGSAVLVILQLQELWQWSPVPDGFADQDVGDGGSLHWPVPGEGVPRGLGDHVVRVAHVGGVIQLRDRHIDTGALGDRLEQTVC